MDRDSGSAMVTPPAARGKGGRPGKDFVNLCVPLLEKSNVLVVFLDGELSIRWANAFFWEQIDGAVDNGPFPESLTPGAAQLLRRSLAESGKGSLDIELHHPVSGGVRVVTYRFLRDPSGSTVGIGIDRSQEMEMVQQMAVLLEELESEMEQRITLTEKLEELAITDPLTGIHNRRYFDEVFEREWTRWERYRYRFGLILVDIDNFKSFNDTHGHQIGDEVLKRVATAVEKSSRAGDVVARYGGEEFAIITLGTTAAAAVSIGKRLHRRIRSAPMPRGIGRVTVSIGVATSESPELASSADLVRQADERLYRAKREGRDRVIGPE